MSGYAGARAPDPNPARGRRPRDRRRSEALLFHAPKPIAALVLYVALAAAILRARRESNPER